MKTVELFLFEELPDEIQHKIHEEAEYVFCPWPQDTVESWWKFVDTVFPNLKEHWDDTYERFGESYYSAYMCGKRLVKHLYKKLCDLPEYPTGYYIDEDIFGFARKNLDQILKCKMNEVDYANYVYQHLRSVLDEEEQYYNSFDGYRERAEFEDWYYTADGHRVDA